MEGGTWRDGSVMEGMKCEGGAGGGGAGGESGVALRPPTDAPSAPPPHPTPHPSPPFVRSMAAVFLGRGVGGLAGNQ